MVLASLFGDGEMIGLTGILDLAGVFPGSGWPAPVCIVRTPLSVTIMFGAINLVDLGGELNFIGEAGGRGVSSTWFPSCAGTGPLMDPEAVLFAGTGRRPPGFPFVALTTDAESKNLNQQRRRLPHMLEKYLVVDLYLLSSSASRIHCV